MVVCYKHKNWSLSTYIFLTLPGVVTGQDWLHITIVADRSYDHTMDGPVQVFRSLKVSKIQWSLKPHQNSKRRETIVITRINVMTLNHSDPFTANTVAGGSMLLVTDSH